jgi:SAM-dependent methyltransferase
MTDDDFQYVTKLLANGLIQSPCLELGVGYEEGWVCKELLLEAGVDYVGTDMISGPAVDYVVDFEEDWATVQRLLPEAGAFGSALVLNVLEHTFQPVKVLDNVFKVLRPQGTCIVVTPAVWPLHDFPYDCCRLLPNFYEQYCKRRSLQLLDNYFEYVGRGNVRNYKVQESYTFPPPSDNYMQQMKSRIVHKLFNTTARTMFFPCHIAVGLVIRK